MKKLVLLLLVLLPLCSYAQSGTTIYLKIIKEMPPERVDNIKCYVQFSDNKSPAVSEDCKPEEFTSDVWAGKKIKWRKSNDVVANIKKIKIMAVHYKEREGSINILKKKIMVRNFWGNVNGWVKKDGIEDLSQELYSITFKVTFEIDGDSYEETYTIDPVLKFHAK